MIEKQNELDPSEEVEVRREEPAALAKHYRDQGRGFDGLRISLANLKNTNYYVYQFQIRWPTKANPAHMLMCKALHPDGPVIAFHSEYGWAGALLGFAARLRAGAVEWHQDEFPPDDWVERLAWLQKTGYEPG